MSRDHFEHPAHVSVERAFAVHAVLHNRATADTWDVLDAWVRERGLERVLDDIAEILRVNGLSKRIDDERVWWRSHLVKGQPS